MTNFGYFHGKLQNNKIIGPPKKKQNQIFFCETNYNIILMNIMIDLVPTTSQKNVCRPNYEGIYKNNVKFPSL